jgi:polar amino acid transport system substrate-binding protein
MTLPNIAIPNDIQLSLRCFISVLVLAVLGGCANTMLTSNSATAMVRTELAPSGKLRAAINFGNPILATRDAATQEPRGVSVDLARELAKRLDVPVELVTYSAAGKVVEGIKSGEWDIAFFAIDPVRAADTDFTAAYVVIEGAYLVPQDSPIQRNEDVDREGVRVVVGRGSAYDLYLTRELKQAKLLRAATSPTVTDTMVAEKAEVAAGVKQQLQADAKRLPGLRLLDGRFMVINQAMAIPKGRPAGAAYATKFIEEMKSSGFVAEALKRHRIEGAAVAPAQ